MLLVLILQRFCHHRLRKWKSWQKVQTVSRFAAPKPPPPPPPQTFFPIISRFPSILVTDLQLVRIANRTSSSVSRRPIDDYFVEALAQSVTFTWTNLFSRVRCYRARKTNTKERKKTLSLGEWGCQREKT
jgi:hypothetical protein